MKQLYRILIINVAFIGNATCMKMMAHSVVVVVVVVVCWGTLDANLFIDTMHAAVKII